MNTAVVLLNFFLPAVMSDDPKTPDSTSSPAQTPAPVSPIIMSDVANAATIPTEKTVEELKAK